VPGLTSPKGRNGRDIMTTEEHMTKIEKLLEDILEMKVRKTSYCVPKTTAGGVFYIPVDEYTVSIPIVRRIEMKIGQKIELK